MINWYCLYPPSHDKWACPWVLKLQNNKISFHVLNIIVDFISCKICTPIVVLKGLCRSNIASIYCRSVTTKRRKNPKYSAWIISGYSVTTKQYLFYEIGKIYLKSMQIDNEIHGLTERPVRFLLLTVFNIVSELSKLC